MECPHLHKLDELSLTSETRSILGNSQGKGSATKLSQPAAATEETTTPKLSTTSFSNSRGTRSGKGAQPNQSHSYQCYICKSDRSPWMCVLCGKVHCGRYVNSHARKHYLNDSQHFLAICCHSRATFCYACDDYVINENQSKRILRVLEQFNADEPALSAAKTSKRKNLVGNPSKVSPSASAKNKRIRLAGIRNLGNTCFMNSVLQCLSNIQRFTSSVGDPPCGGKLISEALSNGTGIHKRKLMQIANSADNSKPELLYETLRNTIYLLKKSGKSFIIPETLFSMIGRNPRFRGYQQQDAHEFLRYVLDRLDKEYSENKLDSRHQRSNNSTTNNHNSTGGKRPLKYGKKQHTPTIIGNIFGGVLQNEVNCLECGFKSFKQDPFMDLSLDIPLHKVTSHDNCTNKKQATSSDSTPTSNQSDNSNLSSCNSNTNDTTGSVTNPSTGSGSASNNNNNKHSSDTCNLVDCLSSFIELEELTETELYYCSNCQKRQRSTKRFWIRRLPDVLCLHLKRFRYNEFLRTKIDNYIEFPTQNLDMKRFVMTNKHETRGSSCGPSTYDLVAFIEHHGSGLGAGHYTAYCRHEGYWFHFDDSSVTVCDENTVIQSKAYILFYNRRAS